jgi:radical SAM protein with 4Fe4S-binding SPASM domain
VRLLRDDFGVASAPYARAYIREPALFAVFDREALAHQIETVRAACAARGIRFYSQPRTTTPDNLDRYLRGEFSTMVDRKQRCAVPWTHAEISARGDVTTCHTFYDAPVGNVYEQSLLDIWNGPRLAQLRSHLRKGLLPICTACCRYYQ